MKISRRIITLVTVLTLLLAFTGAAFAAGEDGAAASADNTTGFKAIAAGI